MVMLIDQRRFSEGLQPVPAPFPPSLEPGDPGYWKLWEKAPFSQVPEPSIPFWGSSIEGALKIPGIVPDLRDENLASIDWGAFWGWPWGPDRDDQSNEENPKGSEKYPYPEFGELKEPVTPLMDYLMVAGFILLGVWVAGKM